VSDDHPTAVVARYTIAVAGGAPADPIVRAPLDRAFGRMRLLRANFLHRCSRRQVRPAWILQMDEVLAADAKRLLKAVRLASARTVREFFGLPRAHSPRKLDDLAQRLDGQWSIVELCEDQVETAERSNSADGPGGRRMLEAIGDLPEAEREVFDLVRIQGMTQAKAAQSRGGSALTAKRRLSGGLRVLSVQLSDLGPGVRPPGSIEVQSART
jgi:RNA polymerase sigma-70 factor (ECF subfamily)